MQTKLPYDKTCIFGTSHRICSNAGYFWPPLSLSDTHSVKAEVQINGLDSNKFGFEADADLITYLLGYRNNFLRTGNFDVFAGAGIGYSKAEFYVAPDAQTEQDLIIGFARIGADYSVSERFYLLGEESPCKSTLIRLSWPHSRWHPLSNKLG